MGFILKQLRKADRFIVCASLSLLFPVSVSAGEVFYSYDDMNRLIKTEQVGSANIDYVYDALGNALAITEHNETANSNPSIPDIVAPLDQATDVAADSVQLQWSSSDADVDDQVYYDLYFGEQTPPPLYKAGLSSAEFVFNNLNSFTTYNWKVVARDNHNAISEGAVWSFVTGNTPPPAPLDPIPANDGSIGNYQSVTLKWDAAIDLNTNDSITYDIYFGPAGSQLVLVAENYLTTSYTVTGLDPWLSYNWKVVAKDNHGAVSQSDTWVFHPLDSDGDGFPDDVENTLCINPLSNDTDGDGLADGVEDSNRNGVVDAGETDPCNNDTDGDSMPDGWEVTYSFDPLVNDAALDFDGDGIDNVTEYFSNTNPTNASDYPSVSVIYENFEQGEFNGLFPLPLNGGNAPWQVSTTRTQSGTYAAKSGSIGRVVHSGCG